MGTYIVTRETAGFIKIFSLREFMTATVGTGAAVALYGMIVLLAHVIGHFTRSERFVGLSHVPNRAR